MNEQQIKLRDEARLMAMAAPILIPDLERKEQTAINRLIMEYRSGATNLHAHVGEIAILRDMLREIKLKAQNYEGA